MELHFTKMEGIGNDYIYVDGINQEVPMDAEFISRISNRHFGIGGDGMIVILKSDQYDFKMRMFNLDGSEGMMCGNGIRCFAKFCYDHHLTDKKVLNIETKAGLRIVELIFDGDEVVGAKVDMQEPILNCKDIPVIFDQEKMIHDILKQRIISLKQAITMSGHSLSMKRVLAMVSPSGVIDEYSSGIAYYKWLKELDDHFDFVALKQKLESVYQNVCFYNRLTLSFTGNDDTNLEKQVLYLKETLKVSDALAKAIIKPFSIKKEGIIIPSDIAYASKGGYLLETSKITPLASNIISLAYLWNVVRVQGGAYGTGLVSRASGFTCCYSYRDPNGKESLKKYEKCGTFLKDYLEENHDLTGFIIGTLSGLMPLMMPYNIGKYGDLYYFNQKDEKARQEQLEAILNVDKDELLEIAKEIDETLEKGGICIIGGKNQIDQCDLDEVISL